MPITAGSAILQSDIATIVSSINSEITRRHPNSLSALSAPTQGNVALATDAIALITALTTLNTTHKNVTTAGIQTHSDSGGHTKTLTASASNFIAGSSKMTATSFAAIATDIATLVAQSACTNTTTSCSTNPSCCNTNVACSTVCNNKCCNGQGCYGQSCGCNTVSCNCNVVGCQCNGVCATNGCTSNIACSCNTVCSCEFV